MSPGVSACGEDRSFVGHEIGQVSLGTTPIEKLTTVFDIVWFLNEECRSLARPSLLRKSRQKYLTSISEFPVFPKNVGVSADVCVI
jgi:hypothetical protein